MVLHTNDRHRFLKDSFQLVNSFQYATAVFSERDKYSWDKPFISIKCIFMNKWLPLPLIVFAVHSVKNGPRLPWLLLLSLYCYISWMSVLQSFTDSTIAMENTKMFPESPPTHFRLDSSTTLQQALMAGFIWLSNYFAGKAFYIENLCVHVCTVISMVDPPLSNMTCCSTALPTGFIKNPGGRICIHWTTVSSNCQHPVAMALLRVF